MKNPLLQKSSEEIQNMSQTEFANLLEQSNVFVRNKYSTLHEFQKELPQFNSEEEMLPYFHAISLEDANAK